MNPQTQPQLPLAGVQHATPLAALLNKPHVPSKTPRFTAPAPKKRKYKMVWVETVTYTERNVCAQCGLSGCPCTPREIKRTRHVKRTRQRQYVD